MEWQQGAEQQLMERSVSVLQNFVLAHALIFTDAPHYVYQLIVDGITPFISSYAVCYPAGRIIFFIVHPACMQLLHRGIRVRNANTRRNV